MKKPTDKEINTLIERVYKHYGTGSGILFGLPSEYREVLPTIVGAVLDKISWED